MFCKVFIIRVTFRCASPVHLRQRADSKEPAFESPFFTIELPLVLYHFDERYRGNIFSFGFGSPEVEELVC